VPTWVSLGWRRVVKAIPIEEVLAMSRETISAKILVVDDDTDILKGLALRLESNGFVVLQAMTAVSAIVLARAEDPDVIVLDLGLPDLDGYTFMKQLKEFPATAHIPVIVLTGRDPQGNQERSYDIGAFDFFQKPVVDKWFLASIERALAARLPKKIAGSS
jgi:DNA-binding response OmpR family regulator